MSRWVTPNNLESAAFDASVRASLLLGVKDTSLLEGLGKDWDGRVDGVGDD
jgi:hypothetical protein